MIKAYLIKDILETLLTANVDMISHVLYLDYENCKCRKRLVDRSADECDENIDGVKIVSESKNKCNSCIFYIVLFSIFFTINAGVAACLVYYKYVNRNKVTI